MQHVDAYLKSTHANPIAREFLEQARRPSFLKDHDWLREHRPWVSWQGVRYRCVGASTLGDVLLKKAHATGSALYDYRVAIEELSDWAWP